VLLGLSSLNAPGLTGGLLQTVNHGLWTGALFLLLGALAERRGTCRLADLGGLAAEMPRFAALFLVFALAAAGIPALNGFVGGLTVLLGAFDRVWWWAALAALGAVLMAAALLRVYQGVFLGPLDNPENRGLRDLTAREAACLLPLALLCFWIGLYPQPFLRLLEPPVRRILAQLAGAGG
jgi:NADH-quinone oxidoreductase subunit M